MNNFHPTNELSFGQRKMQNSKASRVPTVDRPCQPSPHPVGERAEGAAEAAVTRPNQRSGGLPGRDRDSGTGGRASGNG